jgi:zinc protease
MRRWLALFVAWIAVAAGAAAFALGPKVEESTLPNGATLLISEQHNLPMVVVNVIIDAGARRDPTNLAGLANLTAQLLSEGTTTRSAAEIKEAIDFIGASLDAGASTDHASISLQVLREDLDVALELVVDVLLHPAFRSDELERRREAVLASIRAARDNPSEVAQRAFRRALYGSEPYGHAVAGEEETVPRIRRSDVEEFYRQFYRPEGAAVIVVGDIAAAEAREKVEKALHDWRGSSGSAFVYPTQARPDVRTVRIDKPVSQASIILGHRGVARDTPDFEAISVMNYILGLGGFSSRLMESIRTKAGLAYSVTSYFVLNKAPGSFRVEMQTKNESASDAIRLARAEVERIRTEPVSDEELNDAIRYLTGSYPLRLDSNSNILEYIGQTWLYDLGFDYADRYIERVKAVTKEDVLRVAKQYLHPDEFVEVIVADLAQAKLPES